MAESLPYKTFSPTHPEYDAAQWARQRALYAGGAALLANPQVMADVFPQHTAEAPHVYQERKARAFYLNYPGAIIDSIVAGLFAEQPSFEADPKADAWYEDFCDDCSLPGGRRVSFSDLLKTQVRNALLHRRAWTLVELPAAGATPESAGEEEASGALDAYACPVAPECVRDWEMDEDGRLAWVLLAFQRSKRDGLTGSREKVEEEFVYYTPQEFARYAITYKRDKPPKDDEMVPLVASGTHSFGRVPLLCLELPEGLHAMGKLESIAVAHLNTRNALSWAQYKSLFPVLTHFQAPEDINDARTADPNRAVDQARSPAHMVVVPAGDRFEFVGPSSEAFSAAQADLAVLRDEMYRVVHHMADSVDNSGAALQRSGDSKQADRASTTIILKFIGEEISKHACEILETVGAGRHDPECTWTVHGMDEFGIETESMDDMSKEAAAVMAMDINSPSFQVDWKFKKAKIVIGEDATAKRLEQYRKELEQNNPPEQYAPGASMPGMPGMPAEGEEEAPEDDAEGEGEEPPEEGTEPAKDAPPVPPTAPKTHVAVAAHIRKRPGAKVGA